jgi:hypothetical protein
VSSEVAVLACDAAALANGQLVSMLLAVIRGWAHLRHQHESATCPGRSTDLVPGGLGRCEEGASQSDVAMLCGPRGEYTDWRVVNPREELGIMRAKSARASGTGGRAGDDVG